MRHMPPLTALRAFEAVGRLGAIKDAADALGVTPAAVTHQIRSLEVHLGMALFERGQRGLLLNAPGEAFLPAVTQAFELILQGVNGVCGRMSSRLRVNSLPTFASSWLAPRLRHFHEIHPEIDLEINTEGRLGAPLDFTRTEADVAIRAGLSGDIWSGHAAEKLLHETMFPACAPALLRGPNPLRAPKDLANQTLLIASRSPEGWAEWLGVAGASGQEMPDIDPTHGPKFDTIQLAMNAAIEGMGVVIGRTPLVDAYLESGQLVEPFDIRVTSRIAYWLVGRKEAWDNHPVQAFRAWLRQELGLGV